MKSNKIFNRVPALLLSALMLVFCIFPVGAASNEGKDYTVTNPYSTVNWDTWGAYKTQLHCHTTASDGFLTIKELVQKSYDLGYDIVAVTDHGTLNQGWDTAPQLVPLIRLVKYERTKMSKIEPLSAQEYETFINGTAPTTNGTVRKNGMLDVPLGIELNMATPVADCHLTGYFSTYGQGLAGVFGDYETPSAGVKAAGGLSMLSHVGEYVYTDKDSENHIGQPVDDYYATKFARLFLDNQGSSLGMGINSATDAHTRCDRILYDQVLAKTIPNGVTPWGFTFSDAHNEGALDDAYVMTMMENFNLNDFRQSMENGCLFAVSHYSYGMELNGMWEISEDFVAKEGAETPMVTRVTVDESEDTISIEADNYDTITWVSNGQVICRGGTECATLDLDEYADDISLYVRFYITGDGGICYSQPFTLTAEGETIEPVEVPETKDVSTFLRKLVTVVDYIFFRYNPIIWGFKYFALGYSTFER